MSFLNKIFGKKEAPIKSYSDFWNWFLQNEKDFFSVVKKQENIQNGFFSKLSPKLAELREGFYFLTGMLDDHTVELILTADSNIKNIAFVEDLVAAAPSIPGWKITALKPALTIDSTNISMDGYEYNKNNLKFYYTEHENYPDVIDLTIVYDNYNDENKDNNINGIYIFLDNYLGELDFVNNIDIIKVTGPKDATKVLIPIEKLKDFLNWRQKEFVEKYEGIRHNTENDLHTSFEADLPNGNKAIAIINTEILQWDSKASHPWFCIFTIKYDGSRTNGMPTEKDMHKMDQMQDEMLEEMKDNDGYLYIGRQTADGEREVYFACRDFRKPSKVFEVIEREYSVFFKIDYEIYKDKYWQTLERYSNVEEREDEEENEE